MKIRIQQIKLPPAHTREDVRREACRILHISEEECRDFTVVKQSIDARKKKDIRYIYTADVTVKENRRLKAMLQKNPQLTLAEDVRYHFPSMGSEPLSHRPVIVGMGPAGLFCGLMLARAGYRPIVLERGERVERREEIVAGFWDGERLDLRTNVQFGEGGAGTFSDGKLNTLVKDNSGRNRKVLECFVEAGAPADILYRNKPHIGTDVLRNVVRNIRQEIEEAGGEVCFGRQVTEIEYETGPDGEKRLSGILTDDSQRITCEICVLAIGHSARDTFELLYRRGLAMSPKAFAVGVRIQHPQKLIDEAQYGEANHMYLPAADYKVTYQASNGRSVYSFCMCPGGYVVNASSEEKRLAVNGMSYHDRAGENANSALIVSVTPEDFPEEVPCEKGKAPCGKHPLAGVEFQRRLEEAAWRAGDGAIPVQLYADFKKGVPTAEAGKVKPCIKGAYAFAELRGILPAYVSEALVEGIEYFGTRIRGFDRPDAILAAVESRTSSPVRIERDDNFESNIKGLYPCGEGAGYAGGITSAAMDGIKVAEAIAKRYHA